MRLLAGAAAVAAAVVTAATPAWSAAAGPSDAPAGPSDAPARPAGAADGRARGAGAWAAAPQAPTESFLPNWSVEGFGDHTVRQVVRPTAGGTRLRIRLSNRYGSAPLPVAGATVAVSGGGAAIDPSTLKRVRFGGAGTATVPVGGELTSDFVGLKVRAFQPVSVTLRFREPTGPATFHATAIATSYRATGDHLTDPGGAAFGETSVSWYYLTGLDVTGGPPPRGGVVVFGDSITDGAGSTVDANNRVSDELAERLAARREARPVLNAGISGNRVLNDSIWFGESALDRFDRDVPGQVGEDTVVILEGVNDIGFSEVEGPGFEPNPEVTAAELIAGHRALVRRARAAGLRVVGGTITPFEGAFYFTPRGEAVRDAVNHWIRTSGAYDAVADFDRALADPAHPDRLHPDFDSGDHLHPDDDGYSAMAEAAAPEVVG